MGNNEKEVLKVRDLMVRFYTYAGVVKALEGVNFDVKKKETFGIVGETGSGKSVTALSILGLTPPPGKTEKGTVLFQRDGRHEDLTKLEQEELRRIRGNEISMVFQEPSEALNPVYTIGDQVAEAFMAHRLKGMVKTVKKEIKQEIENTNPLRRTVLKTEMWLYDKMVEDPESGFIHLLSSIPLIRRFRNRLEDKAIKRAEEMLSSVGIPDPDDVVDKYPHELSGGMNQRAVISIALACNPRLLIADEPTSNLDVSIQARIIDILNGMKEEYGLSILYITHDLGVVAQTCDRAGVMYGGRIIEIADVEELYENPKHPYTRMLLNAVPTPEKNSLEAIGGSVPELISPPSGCRFHPRCPLATDKCSKKHPDMEKIKDGHYVACYNWEEWEE